MLEYVLTVSIAWEQCCNQYKGTFSSCEQAQQYYDLVLADDYKGMSCLLADHVILPQGFEHHYITVTEPVIVND
jgi:hypothetical protein